MERSCAQWWGSALPPAPPTHQSLLQMGSENSDKIHTFILWLVKYNFQFSECHWTPHAYLNVTTKLALLMIGSNGWALVTRRVYRIYAPSQAMSFFATWLGGAKVIIFSLPVMLTTLALSRIQLILDLLVKDWCQLEEMKAISFSLSTLALSSIPLMLRSDQEVVFAPSAATWEEWRSSAPPSERMRRRLRKKSPITPHLLPREKPHFPSRSGGCSDSTFPAWKSQICFIHILQNHPTWNAKKGLKSSPKLSIPLLFDWQSRSQWC